MVPIRLQHFNPHQLSPAQDDDDEEELDWDLLTIALLNQLFLLLPVLSVLLVLFFLFLEVAAEALVV